MDLLLEIIHSLSPGEEKSLVKYLDYKSNFKDRIDKKLLQLMRQDNLLTNDDLIVQLYNLPPLHIPVEKRNSYYQWRSILSNNIEDFILQQITTEDKTHYIIKLTLIARFLFNRKKYKAALKYLRKAESIASDLAHYNLLDRIYSLRIEYAWVSSEINMDELMIKWKQNAELLAKDTSINAALGLLHYRIVAAHKLGRQVDIDKLIHQILSQFNIDTEAVGHNVKTRYKIAMLVKTPLVEKGKYSELTNFLVRTYLDMEKKHLFDKYSHRIKVELLTDICNAAVKGKQYDTCEKYINIVNREHELYPGYTFLNVKSIMTQYVLYSITNRPNEAAGIIQKFENSFMSRIVQEDDYYFVSGNLNLLSSKYAIDDVNGAKKYLVKLLNSERRVLNHTGYAGLFCCQVVDCMFNFDLKEYEYVIQKIKAIRRRFKIFLAQPGNIRYKLFLKILHYWAHHADNLSDKKINNDLNDFLTMNQPALGSGEFIPFTPWVRSKLEKRKYYDVLREIMQ